MFLLWFPGSSLVSSPLVPLSEPEMGWDHHSSLHPWQARLCPGGRLLWIRGQPVQWRSDDGSSDDSSPDDGSPNDGSPDDASPDDASPDDASPDDASPDDGSPDDGSPDDASPDDASPDDGSPDDGSPDDASPDDASPDDASPDDASPDDGSPDDGSPDSLPLTSSSSNRPICLLKRSYLKKTKKKPSKDKRWIAEGGQLLISLAGPRWGPLGAPITLLINGPGVRPTARKDATSLSLPNVSSFLGERPETTDLEDNLIT
ncbi:hypothetical protein NHX12_027039 [Muraenolepis orangiensis]|uniref:Uncharacterized protein n=1 Tax=Muraenolepis orangiensis TaxID=630683 RepID=A0A9Q0EER0_9TELE|nr:hypothetical protein NHX12_027039 [Muraenolepis orangiensis]